MLRRRDEQLILPALDSVLEPDQRILEIGAGTGNYTVRVARRCQAVVAVDASPAMLGYLDDRLRREGITNVEPRLGRLPGEIGVPGRFDGVLALGVLNYVQDLDATLKAFAGALKPGGWAIFTVAPPSLEGRVHALVERYASRRVFLFSRGDIQRAAIHAGLEVVVTGTAGVTRGGITLLAKARRSEDDSPQSPFVERVEHQG